LNALRSIDLSEAQSRSQRLMPDCFGAACYDVAAQGVGREISGARVFAVRCDGVPAVYF
jgi:hypothetical protein